MTAHEARALDAHIEAPDPGTDAYTPPTDEKLWHSDPDELLRLYLDACRADDRDTARRVCDMGMALIGAREWMEFVLEEATRHLPEYCDDCGRPCAPVSCRYARAAARCARTCRCPRRQPPDACPAPRATGERGNAMQEDTPARELPDRTHGHFCAYTQADLVRYSKHIARQHGGTASYWQVGVCDGGAELTVHYDSADFSRTVTVPL